MVARNAAVRLESAPPLVGRDIVCFSNDWHGDPLSKTHLMRILARDNRVLWVNSLGLRGPQATARDVRRIADRISRITQGVREVEPNLFVLSPLALPPSETPFIVAANREIVGAQVRLAMRWLRFSHPISWSFLPSSAPISGELGEDLVIYQCVDEFSAFEGTARQTVLALEERLCRRANLVFASAERLVETKRLWNPRTFLVLHGTDYAHFSRALDPETPMPPELAQVPKPVLGFFGLLAEWIDWPLVRYVADQFPHGTVVLVGQPKADLSALKGAPNIRILGRRPYARLPSFCKAFDVALLPFAVNELTLASNPLKVREYLAAGLPVVSTPIPEVESLGLCHIARTKEEFVNAIRAALAAGGGPQRKIAESIRHESWEARVEEIRVRLRDLSLA